MSLRTSLNLDFVRMGRVSGPLYDTEAKKLDPLLTFSRASMATRFNSSGVLETVGSGVPRFDFDPVTLQCRGLLMEESRTNLAVRTVDMTDGSWPLWSSGVTNRTYLGGMVTEFTDTADPDHYVAQSLTLADNVTVSYSVEVRSSGATPANALIWFVNKAMAAAGVVLNLSDGSVMSTRNDSGLATIRTLNRGGGWWRVEITYPSGTGGALPYAIVSFRDGAGGDYVGNGTRKLQIRAFQVELGSFATSYIPTTDAAATRAAEFCYASTLVPWFNPTAGTIAAEHTSPINLTYASRGNRVAVIYQFSDGTFANRMLDYLDTVTNGAVVSGDVIRHFNWGAVTPGVPVKSALRYSTTALSYINGVATAAAGGPVPTGITRLDLGNYHIGTDQLNGHLRRFTYLPHALSDLTLKALTQ